MCENEIHFNYNALKWMWNMFVINVMILFLIMYSAATAS